MSVRNHSGVHPAPGLLGAAVLHVAAYLMAGAIDPPPKAEEDDLIVTDVIEVVEKEKPKPPEPEVEEPEPEPPKQEEPPPPEPEVKPKKPPPKKKLEPKSEPEPKPAPAPPPAPKRFELPPSATIPANSGGDVKVATGAGASSGSNTGSNSGGGTKPGSGDGKGPGGGSGPGLQPGPPWSPKNDLYIAQQPKALRVPELECPAVSERQISGTVVLLVQVQRDGQVRSTRVTKHMGHGCDDIAKKAMRKARFAPAIGTDGKAADYELRYEYAFELRD